MQTATASASRPSGWTRFWRRLAEIEDDISRGYDGLQEQRIDYLEAHSRRTRQSATSRLAFVRPRGSESRSLSSLRPDPVQSCALSDAAERTPLLTVARRNEPAAPLSAGRAASQPGCGRLTKIAGANLMLGAPIGSGASLMNAVVVGVIVAAVTFAGGLAGMLLHRSLPESVSSGALKDMTGAIGGLLTLLTALVLGLLIWTAYGVYAGQTATVRTLATQFLELDQALTDYGTDAAAGRAQLRDDVARIFSEIWGDDKDYAARNFRSTLANLHGRAVYLTTLHPQTDEQKQALATATEDAKAIAKTRLQMAVALTDPVSRPLVIVVAWSVCLFIGYGLMHTRTLDALIAMAIGSIAVATAVYLLVDLSHPYSGLFQVLSEPITDVLALLGK